MEEIKNRTQDINKYNKGKIITNRRKREQRKQTEMNTNNKEGTNEEEKKQV